VAVTTSSSTSVQRVSAGCTSGLDDGPNSIPPEEAGLLAVPSDVVRTISAEIGPAAELGEAAESLPSRT
jgi:hypothetical protein